MFVKNIKNIVKKIPGALRIYKKIRLKILGAEKVFTEKYLNNSWGGTESVSGSGSDLVQTGVVIKELTKLLRDLKVATILDVACGDFNWMSRVDLSGIKYTGVDIVEDIIQQNKAKYEKENTKFGHLDLIKDELPRVDLVVFRDVLVHFSYSNIFLALKNICRSKSTYLLTTNFMAHENTDIQTGNWRPLNLSKSPFRFPEPLKVISEGCTEEDGLYADKSLVLWKIEDITRSLVSIK